MNFGSNDASAQKPKPGEGALHHSTPANRLGRIDDEKQAANDDFAAEEIVGGGDSKQQICNRALAA